MDRIILSEGRQQEGLSKAQINQAVGVFADAQKEAGVSAGKYTPIIAISDDKKFIIDAHYQNDGECETVNIRHCAPIEGRIVQKKHRDTLTVDVTTPAQKAARTKAANAKKTTSKKSK